MSLLGMPAHALQAEGSAPVADPLAPATTATAAAVAKGPIQHLSSPVVWFAPGDASFASAFLSPARLLLLAAPPRAWICGVSPCSRVSAPSRWLVRCGTKYAK